MTTRSKATRRWCLQAHVSNARRAEGKKRNMGEALRFHEKPVHDVLDSVACFVIVQLPTYAAIIAFTGNYLSIVKMHSIRWSRYQDACGIHEIPMSKNRCPNE